MYPLKFNHIYFETVWGGRSMEFFREDLPEGKIGESWDISSHKNGTNIIINGKYKGMSLQELIDKNPVEVLGKSLKDSHFPLHISLLDARDNLSVQVHPNDEFAFKVEGEPGKTEAWYIFDCDENATLVAGLKNCSLNDFKEAINQGTVENFLNKVKVKKGDLVLIPSGMVHALGKGILALEISQNSDTTYRVFDYDRGRELHIEKAEKVIDPELKVVNCIGEALENKHYILNNRLKSKDFNIDTIQVKKNYKEKTTGDKFFTFVCVEGSGYLESSNGRLPVYLGDSIFIPAITGEYEFCGNMTLIKSYVS